MIEIKVNDNGIQAALQKLQAGVSDLTPTMRKVAATMKEAVWQNFDTEGKRIPGGWPDLSAKTKKKREREGTWPGKILQVASILYGSITEESGADFARAGSNLDYAAIQQMGGRAGRNKKVWIPPRPYLILIDEDIKDIEDDIIDDIAKLLP